MLGAMAETTGRWTVGDIAATSGLTVRTLHHWDEIGLVSPQARGAGGRREYSEQDLGRLSVVLTLRQMGLDLTSIRTCLDAGLDPVRVLTDHLGQLERALAALTRLRDQVSRFVAVGAGQDLSADPAEMLRLMQATRSEADGVLERYLSAEQRERIASGAAEVGPALAYVMEVEWPQLYRRAEELRLAGAGPGDPRVQEVAGRMEQLSARVAADAADAGAAVREAWRAEPAKMSGESEQVAGPWRQLAEFVDEARSINREAGR